MASNISMNAGNFRWCCDLVYEFEWKNEKSDYDDDKVIILLFADDHVIMKKENSPRLEHTL